MPYKAAEKYLDAMMNEALGPIKCYLALTIASHRT